ncbi:MAG: type II toxin-antitoxin system prevent-host-death family antitoxin [Anaerolineae bacterium]|nr:type II toxin-antitoxin system prevent-host-death family antitoxin [Anaerolineae bacterium]
MESVGVRELKQRASEIIRLVREQKQEVEITYRGETVARIVPVFGRDAEERDRDAWEELRRIGKEISRQWPKGVSAVEAIREDRGAL